jgi:NAD(P)-dependent dehydrogenase (short-subunit alcohol dehydrogenase family)
VSSSSNDLQGVLRRRPLRATPSLAEFLNERTTQGHSSSVWPTKLAVQSPGSHRPIDAATTLIRRSKSRSIGVPRPRRQLALLRNEAHGYHRALGTSITYHDTPARSPQHWSLSWPIRTPVPANSFNSEARSPSSPERGGVSVRESPGRWLLQARRSSSPPGAPKRSKRSPPAFAAIAVATDVTDTDAVDRLARAAVEAFGSLTIWVNNAGGSPARLPMTELSREDWDACLSLNLTAVWVGIVTAAKYMDRGSIINISSGAGTGPVPGSGHYGAAKAGVNSLTMTASAELAPRIRVNGIAPGAVPTEIFKKAVGITNDVELADAERAWNIPLGRFGTPLDMGAAVLFLCSPGATWITGETLRVGGGAKPR